MYNISHYLISKFKKLEDYEICVICDDSGSMNISVYNNINTRWSELQISLKIITDIVKGLDIYYLNRPPIRSVTNSNLLYYYPQYYEAPSGFTPLGETIEQVLEDKKYCNKKLLLIIFTDGQPNDMELFIDVLLERNPIDKIIVSLVACTDDYSSIGYMNGLDKKIPNLKINADYNTEKQKLLKIHGKKFIFTFGDYIAKILLNSINVDLDELYKPKKRSFCVIS